LQNLNQVMLADVRTGAVRTLFEDKDSAWVDYVRSLDWVQNGKGLLWLSERDGWRHAYVISLSDGKTTLITNFRPTSSLRFPLTMPASGSTSSPRPTMRRASIFTGRRLTEAEGRSV
jgi:hypothetical protein